MKTRHLVSVLLVIAICILAAGCSQPAKDTGQASAVVTTGNSVQPAAAGVLTPANLTPLVKKAVAYARENGKEKAIAVFNDPQGQFVSGDTYIFAEAYDGTALAEPFEHALVGTNIRNLTDRYGLPLVRNLEETAGYGIGYVSYDYRNPKNNNTVEPKLSVVADVDGTYYVGAGTYASTGQIYPSTVYVQPAKASTVTDLATFVGEAAGFARKNGKENATAAFNDPQGPYAKSGMKIIALDYNGTVLASTISPELPRDHINLINYHDPDGVATIREMRDLVRNGGGYSYTVTKVTRDGRDIFIPKIDYAEPVDGTWWLFSGITVPGYEQLGTGNVTGIGIRNQTRDEAYDLLVQAADFAQKNGREKTLAEINNPQGRFTSGNLFVWAESFDGTVLADPYWKEAIGKNFMNYTDRYGATPTITGINAIRSGNGFSRAMFADTTVQGSMPVPKLTCMRAIDDTWWIGSGIYGVQVT
nr:cache domain-containing protein [uncultured Methanoregula sp.]